MIKWTKVFVWPALAILVFFAGWFTGYHSACKRGKQYAVSAVADAVKEHLEARDKLRDALIDLMEYKIKLQEKEGGK